MDQRKKSDWTAMLVALLGGAVILIGVGNPRVPAGAQYMPPPMPQMPQMPHLPSFPQPVQPIDGTHTFGAMQIPPFGITASSAGGVGLLKGFPTQDQLGGSLDFLLVIPQGHDDSIEKLSPYAVRLRKGTVLASVKKPSRMGMLITTVAEVAFSANSDAFVQVSDGAGPLTSHLDSHHSPYKAIAYLEGDVKDKPSGQVVRVRNIDGLGEAIKVHLTAGPFAGKTYAVGPGYEMVAGDHKLSKDEFRPGDGILRRKTQVINDGTAAISQFSVESALQQSALVSQLASKAGEAKARRITSDMSRMAAVLNQVTGSQGYGR